MFDFSAQKDMFVAATTILNSIGITNYALGGGTALSAYFWEHRYSTDIDIFLFEEKSRIQEIRENLTSANTIKILQDLGYQGSFKYPGHYLEIEIDKDKKIQFFERIHHRENAYTQGVLWGIKTNIESVDEIVYKKIFYRAEKSNARDIFDIAVALHKDPSLFKSILAAKPAFIDSLSSFQNTLFQLLQNKDTLNEYKNEINYISPSPQYMSVANLAPQYLSDYLEGFIAIHKKDMLEVLLLSALEKEVYQNIISSSVGETISGFVENSTIKLKR